jgi:hypothetical protein
MSASIKQSSCNMCGGAKVVAGAEVDAVPCPACRPKLSAASQHELEELRAGIRAELDRRTVARTAKSDDEVGRAGVGDDATGREDGTVRVMMPRTVEEYEAQFDNPDRPFDILDWIDGFCPDAEFQVGERERAEGREVLEWLHRDESDSSILMRFATTPDERVRNDPDMSDEEKRHVLAELKDGRNVWRDRQIALRRKQLHIRLVEWFGTPRYTEREVVIGWSQHVDTRKFVPTMGNVLDWIRWSVEERGELSGFASCAAIMKKRLSARKSRAGLGFDSGLPFFA